MSTDPAPHYTPAEQQEYFEELERDVLRPISWPSLAYLAGLGLTATALAVGVIVWGNQILKGLGMAGINNPVGWGVYITDFVFWVGIAHSGTLISAILFLFRARFRSRFNRAAEAMTVFAVMTAGLFPLVHLGRVWFFFFILPYPNQRQLWINFKSPLVWDVFAINTYLTVSAIFWYVGMLPDLAIVRDRTRGIASKIYGALSLGWRGTDRQWRHYMKLYAVLACFATPLVVSVHSVVSWDFAMGIVPGWHTTIFAPYFVAGAILSGCAMVLTLVLPMRKIYKLEKHITRHHIEGIALMLLLTSLIVGYSYVVEFFLSQYSGSVFEAKIFLFRASGYMNKLYWTMVTCNCIIPLTIFIRKLRRNLVWLFILSLSVNVGMWLERYVIIVSSLAKDFDPYAWGPYTPTLTEIGITLGSFGLFFTLFLLFTKLIPVLAITEIKEERAHG